MPRKEWNDDDVRAEIAEAVRIHQEQREKATYAQLHEKYGQPKADPPTDDGKTPPPKKEDDDQPPKKAKRSLYWGDRLDDE